ncbi:MAG: TldD/PmbA family protein [Polyangiales bacterium]
MFAGDLSMDDVRARAREALDALRGAPGLVYADVRFVEEERELLRVRGRSGKRAARGSPTPSVENLGRDRSRGFGVRVFADGGWGFACTPDPRPAALRRAAERALEVARASARASARKLRFVEGEAHVGTYRTPMERDPLEVPLDEKVADLAAATEALGPDEPSVRVAEAKGHFARKRQLLVSTEGTDVEQCFAYTGAGLQCVAVGDDGEAQRRSYPTSVDGDLGQGGYERVGRMRLVEEAPRVREEAVALLTAPPCPQGRRDIVLASDQLALQIHESCGHPVELDRVLGTEISLAGGSFLQPDALGRLRYGAPGVNLVADATCEGGCGTFGYDDEGTPAKRVDLVRDGIFCGYLSSRDTAAELGVEPSGAMRANGWDRIPLIRMVNINLEPGQGSLDDLLGDTDGGLLLETNKSWSIDDLRLHFQFACEVAWEVRGGRKATMYRNPVYSGTTPKFWNACDAITGPEEWRLWGLGSCGKGEPIQLMRVGHGCSPARFRDVEVGHG